MNGIELVNNIALAVIIGILSMVFVQILIRTLNEERRKNTELADKISDKLMDRVERLGKEWIGEIDKMINGTEDKKEKKYENLYKKEFDV